MPYKTEPCIIWTQPFAGWRSQSVFFLVFQFLFSFSYLNIVWLKQKSRLNLFCSDRKCLSTEHMQLTFENRGLWEYQANKTRNDLHSACVCVYLNTIWVLWPESLQKQTSPIYVFTIYNLFWKVAINQSINQSINANTQFVRHYWNFQCAWVSEPLKWTRGNKHVGLIKTISRPICTYFTRWLIRMNSFSKICTN